MFSPSITFVNFNCELSPLCGFGWCLVIVRGLGSGARRSTASLPCYLLATQASFSICVVLVMPAGGNRRTVIASLQLSVMDVSARTTMKGAAKCDKHCDLQNSVNQQGFERILRFRDIPESMPASASASVSCCRRAFRPMVVGLCASAVRFCAPRCSLSPLMHEVHVAAVACN